MSDETRGDLQVAVQMLAADNARLCGILLAAEKLATAAAAHLVFNTRYTSTQLEDAVRTFEITKAGQ